MIRISAGAIVTIMAEFDLRLAQNARHKITEGL